MPDLRLTSTLDIATPASFVDGVELIEQRIRVRLSTFRGEYPLDTSAGLDLVGFLQTMPPDVGLVAAVVAREVLAVDGVGSTEITSSKFNRTTQEIEIKVDAFIDTEAEPVVVEVEARIGPKSVGSDPGSYVLTRYSGGSAR